MNISSQFMIRKVGIGNSDSDAIRKKIIYYEEWSRIDR